MGFQVWRAQGDFLAEEMERRASEEKTIVRAGGSSQRLLVAGAVELECSATAFFLIKLDCLDDRRFSRVFHVPFLWTNMYTVKTKLFHLRDIIILIFGRQNAAIERESRRETVNHYCREENNMSWTSNSEKVEKEETVAVVGK